MKFACDTCKTYFMSEDVLWVHEDVVHNNKNYEDCEKCGKCIPSTDKQTHVEKEHDNKKAKHECKSCGMIGIGFYLIFFSSGNK